MGKCSPAFSIIWNYIADLSTENLIELKFSREFMAKTRGTTNKILVRPHNTCAIFGEPLTDADIEDLGDPNCIHLIK